MERESALALLLRRGKRETPTYPMIFAKAVGLVDVPLMNSKYEGAISRRACCKNVAYKAKSETCIHLSRAKIRKETHHIANIPFTDQLLDDVPIILSLEEQSFAVAQTHPTRNTSTVSARARQFWISSLARPQSERTKKGRLEGETNLFPP